MTNPREPLAERIKAASDGLRGTLREEFDCDGALSPASARLLKFHGIFVRSARRGHSAEREVGAKDDFTVRLKTPAGRLARDRWLTVLDLAERCGTGTVQLTSRQGVQIVGVNRVALAETMRVIHDAGLTTLGSGGDLNCNVMCCPAPSVAPEVADEMDCLAESLSRSLLPEPDGYLETWGLDVAARRTVRAGCEDFAYGPTFLPHKFKIGLATHDDNSIDALVQDVGLVSAIEDCRIVGYHVLVGGGLGQIPSVANSFPRLATPLTFVAPRHVSRLVHAILRLYRDRGDRSSRSRGRFKYLVHDWGIDRIRAHLEHDLGMRLPPPRAFAFAECRDDDGWRRTSDGRWAIGLHAFDGLIEDRGAVRLASALRAILSRGGATVRVLPRRRLLLHCLTDVDRSFVEETLEAHGAVTFGQISPLRRWADACPGIPACNHAITEAHRLLPQWLDELERVLGDLQLSAEPICLRVAACPAGCTRSYLAEIAVVGRTVATDTFEGKYAIYVGGDRGGRRLAESYADLVPASQVVSTLAALLACYKRDRRAGESLGDFCHRIGVRTLRQRARTCDPGH